MFPSLPLQCWPLNIGRNVIVITLKIILPTPATRSFCFTERKKRLKYLPKLQEAMCLKEGGMKDHQKVVESINSRLLKKQGFVIGMLSLDILEGLMLEFG